MDPNDIERLIFDLYHNPQSQIANANKYLTLAQVSKEAWTFSWIFLNPSKPVEVQYFGASSLHMKISRCWHELTTDEDKSTLRNKLLETLVQFMVTDGSSRVVSTRLSVVMSAFVVHSISDFWPSAIDDLIVNLSPDAGPFHAIPRARVVHQLIELLTIIPEECVTIYMPSHAKLITKHKLIESHKSVFNYVHQILRQDTSSSRDNQQLIIDIKQLAIKCFANWSQVLGPLLLEDGHDQLLDLVLECVCDDELIVCAVDSIIAIYSHPEIHKYPNTVMKLIVKLTCLESRLDKALNDRDMDVCQQLFNLFIQVGETHSRLLLDTIATKPDGVEPIIKLITFVLRCSATPG